MKSMLATSCRDAGFRSPWPGLVLAAAVAGNVAAQTATNDVEVQTAEQDVAAQTAARDAAAQTAATYIKASNPGVDDQFGGSAVLLGVSVALSGDGATLAVGSRLEDSAATGIDGDQDDNSARNAGAAYVFGLAANGGWRQDAYVKASNAGPGDQFGFAVALSDDGATLAVSANLEDSAATGVNGDPHDNSMENSGAVYVFRRGDAGWRQEAYVKASNTGEPEDGDNFGYALGLSADGNTLAVGATGEDGSGASGSGDGSDNSARGAGAVYVFAREGGDWTQQAYLKASNADATDLFGVSLAISDDGNTLVIGALDEDGSSSGVGGPDDNDSRGSGAVYVFARDGAQWHQQSYLKASNAARNDAFSMVAVSGGGNTLAVASFDEDSNDTGVGADQTDDSSEDSGAVYVFSRDGGSWAQTAYVKPSNTSPFDQFGTRLFLNRDGSVLAVGAPLEDGSASGVNGPQDDLADEAGAVYLYRRTGDEWRQTAYLKAPASEIYDEYGANVALDDSGETVAVGVRVEDGGAAGIGGDQSDNSVRDSGAVFVHRVPIG